MMRLNEFPTEQELKVMVAEVDQVCQMWQGTLGRHEPPLCRHEPPRFATLKMYYMYKPLVKRKLSCIAQGRGSYCMAEARTAQQIWDAHVCKAESHGGREFPPSLEKVRTRQGCDARKVISEVYASFVLQCTVSGR